MTDRCIRRGKENFEALIVGKIEGSRKKMRGIKGFSLIDETCSRKHFASELYIPKCDERNGRLWIQRVTIHLDGNSKVKGKTAFLKRRERRKGFALHPHDSRGQRAQTIFVQQLCRQLAKRHARLVSIFLSLY